MNILVVHVALIPALCAKSIRGNDATVLTNRKPTPGDNVTLDPLRPGTPRATEEIPGGMHAAQQDPMQKMGAAQATQGGAPAPAEAHAPGYAKERDVIGKWFTWEFWQLMVLCALTLLFFSEVVSSLVHWKFPHSLIVDSGIFCVQMVCFMLVAAIFSSTKSAGGHHTRTLATVMASLSLLIFLGALSCKCSTISPQMHHVADDLGALFKPFSRLICVFLIMNGVLEESAADWGNLVMLGSCIALGIAFAMSGVVKDIVCYMFIRLDDYFCEGEYIYFKGGLYRVNHIFWRYTEAYCHKTRSVTFIPNSEIACNAVNNQSRDDARIEIQAVPLPSGIPAASLEAIVKGTWVVLKGVDETGFTAMNGQAFDCQFDVAKSSVWIDNVQPSSSSKEFACWNLQLKLAGKYRFSKPPKWMNTAPEPPMDKRQLDWQAGWNYQVEWFMLEVKKVIETNSKA